MSRALFRGVVAVVASCVVLAAPLRAEEGTPWAGGLVVETVLDVATDALPSDHTIVAADRLRLSPSDTALTMPALGGFVALAVEKGELTASTPSGERALGPGDTFTADPDEGVSFRVSGGAEVTMFAVYAVAGFQDTGLWESDPFAHRVDFLISTSADSLPGEGRVVLERLTLPSGTTLPPEQALPLVWTEVGEGALGLTLEGEDLPFRWDPGEERTFRPGQYLQVIRPGTTMIFRNAGDAPLVLYRLRIVPAPGASTPSAA
jgi:hypothetical protein